MITSFLKKLNKIICKYWGLDEYEIDRPRTIKVTNKDILIIKNVPFQRHKAYESLCDFNKQSVYEIDEVNKKRIGIAIGKAIANNLIVSFDKIKIRE